MHSLAICFVTFSFHPAIGGVPRKAMYLVEGLVARRHRVTVVTRRLDRLGEPAPSGFPLVRLSCSPWRRGLRKFGEWHFLLNVLFFLVRRRREFDLFHNLTGFSEAFATVLAAKLTRKRVVVSLEGSGLSSELRWVEDKTLFGRWLSRFVSRKADCLVTVNDTMLAELSERGVEPTRRVKIRNAIPLPKTLPTPEEKREQRHRHGVTDGIVVLYTGRIDAMKGVGSLIRAWSDVVRLRPDAVLLIVGDGHERRALERETASLGLSDRIHFLGERGDVEDYLALSDIFVLPSLAEGLSVSLLEAMSYGLASVVSDIPANREVVEDSVDALLVPAEDDRALAKAVLRLCDDTSLRERLGQSAAARIRERFVLEDMIDRYESLYSRLLMTRTTS